MKKFIKHIVSAVIVFAIAAPAVPVSFAAVVTKTDTSTIPGWSVELNKADGGASIDTTEKYSGEASMKLCNYAPSDNGGYLRVSYPVSVKPNHSYVYGFKAKVKNIQGAYAQINWIRTALGYLNAAGNTSDWRNFEFAFTNGSDATAYLRFVLERGAECVWIDDVYFYDTALPQTEENNLIANPSFEGIAKADSGKASGNIIPVRVKKGLKMDGDLSDWEEISPKDIEIYTNYSGSAQSVTGNIRYAWDDDNFYFAIDAEDDVHSVITSGSYWNGDGLQFTICKSGESFGTAYGVVYDDASDEIYKFGDTAIDVGVSRNGNKTVYEIAIPWSSHFDEVPSMALFCAIVNDNDNDGLGRKGCIDVAPGISMYKGSQLFPKMMLLKDEDEFSAYLSGTADVDVGKEAEYALDLFNCTNSEKKLTVKSKKANLERVITLKAGESMTYEFTNTFSDYGENVVDIEVTDGKATYTSSVKTEVCPDAKITEKIIAKQKANLKEVSSLMAKCEEKEIPIEYQKVKVGTIELFIKYLEEDLADGDLTRIAHQDKVMTRLYNEAKEEFNGLLTGERTPVSVPKYVTSPISYENSHFVATTQREDGTKEVRPVFFVGTGHWAQSRLSDEVDSIAKVGFNCMQPEIGPWDAMVEASTVKDWSLKVLGNYTLNTSSSESVVRTSPGKSLKINSTIPYKSNNYCYYRQTFDVKPNTTYEYGLSCKAQNVKNAHYSVRPMGDKSSRKYMNGTYDWRDEKWEYTTTANETQLTYYILIEDTADALYLDDAFVREKGTEKNLIKNGSFDETYPEGQYYAFEESVINSFEKTFAKLEKSNISGIYGAAPHYVPIFLKRDYPDVALPEQYSSFSMWNTRHPKLLEMYEIFYKSLIPRIKDYESFDGVVLANEPQWNTRVSSYAYIDDFRAKMQEKYVTIDALNKRWGTQYASFDEVEMPDSNLDTTPQWHDWREYNDTVLPEFVGHISDYIKSIAPDVFTSVKVMDTFGRQSNFRIWGSNNFEVLKDYEDINGCDAWSLIDTYDIRWKNVFYDFLTSVKNAPIYNTEDHIIIDARKLTYRDDEVKYNIVDLWNGAVHGRGGSVLWLWDRSSRTKNGTIYFNSLLTARPDSVATLGKTTLDINRLSKEIVALQDTPSNVGILYSQNSVPYSDEMLDIIKSVSAYLGENGQKTRFVVESDSDKMFDYGMMIVPNSVSITEQTFEKLKKFVANGGTLLIIGDDALTVNEYGDAFNKSDVDAIKNKSVTMSFEDAGTSISGESKKELRKVITRLVEKNGYDRVKIVDKATGEKITEGDFISAEYDGAFIINFCNYEWKDKEIEIYIDGKKVDRCEDLINFGKYGDTVKAEGYVPLLLKISNSAAE